LDYLIQNIRENLRNIEFAPSVQLQDVPPSLLNIELNSAEKEDNNSDMCHDNLVINEKYLYFNSMYI
jgi:hypothetical protein